MRTASAATTGRIIFLFFRFCHCIIQEYVSALSKIHTSNFHYLSELHPDIVKIDRGFTSKAITDKKEYYLLNQFSNMIHNLGLKLCIEGIETEDELQKMKLLKPDYCQGFYWGRPCSYDEFRKHFVDVDR